MSISDKIKSKRLYNKIINKLGYNPNTLSCQKALVIHVIFVIEAYKPKAQFIGANIFAVCDTAIFTASVLNLLCTYDAPEELDADGFTSLFYFELKHALHKYYGIEAENARSIVKQRTSFYNEVAKNNPDSNLSDIIEEFKIIIKMDCINNSFGDFSLKSPLYSLGPEQDFFCDAEINNYTQAVLKNSRNLINEARGYL